MIRTNLLGPVRRTLSGSRALVLDLERRRARHFGSSPAGNTTTTQSTQPWAGQQPYLSDIYGQSQALDQQAVPQYYPDTTYAGLTPGQTGLMSNLIGYGSGGGNSAVQAANSNVTNTLSPGYTAGTSGAFGQGQDVLSNELSSSFLDPSNSPTYRTAMSNAMASAIPAATASFVNGNRSDSGLASAASTSAAANAAGGLAQQEYNNRLGIQNSAAAQAANNLLTQQANQTKTALVAPAIDQTQIGDLGTALSTAGMNQTDQQNQINANLARFNYGQMLPWNQLGLYENSVAGLGNTGSTGTTTQPYFTNPAANVLSAGTSLGMGAAAINSAFPNFFSSVGDYFSDRRLKTDVKKIGASDSGFPLYTFRYKGEGPMSMHIGVMAQDVEKSRPDAVKHDADGMKIVDYGKALAVDPKGGDAAALAAKGRGGDTMLAHINPREAEMLKAAGGSGTINPKTGLREFSEGYGGGGSANDTGMDFGSGLDQDFNAANANNMSGFAFGSPGAIAAPTGAVSMIDTTPGTPHDTPTGLEKLGGMVASGLLTAGLGVPGTVIGGASTLSGLMGGPSISKGIAQAMADRFGGNPQAASMTNQGGINIGADMLGGVTPGGAMSGGADFLGASPLAGGGGDFVANPSTGMAVPRRMLPGMSAATFPGPMGSTGLPGMVQRNAMPVRMPAGTLTGLMAA